LFQIEAFTPEHVCKLTGLTRRQLLYWDRTGFFSPHAIEGYRARIFNRIYSFRDVVGLRTIALLRKEHHIPLQELRKSGELLEQKVDAPWSTLRFALSGRRLVYFEPNTLLPREARHGEQVVFQVALQQIASDMRAATQRLSERRKEDLGKVARNRYVVHNAWVLAGTRVPTEGVWNFHKAGYSAQAIVQEYPRLTPKDVRAAVKFEEQRRTAA
jgi:DNA-binding transcriptional MerR regulator